MVSFPASLNSNSQSPTIYIHSLVPLQPGWAFRHVQPGEVGADEMTDLGGWKGWVPLPCWAVPSHSASAGSQLSNIQPAKSLVELNPSSSCYWLPPCLFWKPAAKYNCCLDLFNSCLKAWTLPLTTLFPRELFLGSDEHPGPELMHNIPGLSTLRPVFVLELEKSILKPPWLLSFTSFKPSPTFWKCSSGLSFLSSPIIIFSGILQAFTLREWSSMEKWNLKGHQAESWSHMSWVGGIKTHSLSWLTGVPDRLLCIPPVILQRCLDMWRVFFPQFVFYSGRYWSLVDFQRFEKK